MSYRLPQLTSEVMRYFPDAPWMQDVPTFYASADYLDLTSSSRMRGPFS